MAHQAIKHTDQGRGHRFAPANARLLAIDVACNDRVRVFFLLIFPHEVRDCQTLGNTWLHVRQENRKTAKSVESHKPNVLSMKVPQSSDNEGDGDADAKQEKMAQGLFGKMRRASIDSPMHPGVISPNLAVHHSHRVTGMQVKLGIGSDRRSVLQLGKPVPCRMTSHG